MRLVTLLAVLALACGCGSGPVDGHGRIVAEERDDEFVILIGGNRTYFRYVVIDGHEYLMMNPRTAYPGVTHSPKCPCIVRSIEKVGFSYVNGMYIMDVSRENSEGDLEVHGQTGIQVAEDGANLDSYLEDGNEKSSEGD